MNDIELIKYQTLLWIDIWKKKLSFKIDSKYYDYFDSNRILYRCGFCHLFFVDNKGCGCISKGCPLQKWEKIYNNKKTCVVSFYKWGTELNSHAAAHIAWVSRKYYRQIGGEEL